MNAILKPSVSLEIASAKEVQQAMANFAEVSKAWHPVAYEQGLQLWRAKRAAKESASERLSPRRRWQSRLLSRATLATLPNGQLTRRLGILGFVPIVSTVTVVSYKRLTHFKRNDRLVSIFALLAPAQRDIATVPFTAQI